MHVFVGSPHVVCGKRDNVMQDKLLNTVLPEEVSDVGKQAASNLEGLH